MLGIRPLHWAMIALLSAATSARADSLRRPALHWSRAEQAADCIDPKRLAQRVEAITGPVFVSATSAETSIEAQVQRPAPNVYSVRVTTVDGSGKTLGSRTLEFRAGSCREIDEAVAFVIAVSIDPALGSEGLPDEVLGLLAGEEPPERALLAELQETPPAQPRQAAVAASSVAVADVPRNAPAGAAATDRWQIDLGGALALGATPSAAAGLFTTITRGLTDALDVSLQLQAAFGIAAQSISTGRSLNGSAFDLALLACPRWKPTHLLTLRGCAGAFAGLAMAHGNGFSEDELGVLPRIGGAVRADVGYALAGGWQLIAAVSGTLDANRGQFVYHTRPDETGVAHDPNTFGVSVGLGLGVRF